MTSKEKLEIQLLLDLTEDVIKSIDILDALEKPEED